ncbi:DUF4199 domain-containing protein [Alistipes sp.]|uniref:DUF4199 domain-containing protein n=1 Tax=Alistipes sp. TaxID=1872444 RepID=UPI003AF0BCC3
MENSLFWKKALRGGAIVGLLLAVSFMLETRMMLAGSFGLYALEWFLVAVLHYYLLHRFTRSYSATFPVEEGFRFGRGYGFVLSMSVVAGVIVGLVQYLYLHLFIGYEHYTGRVADALTEMLSRGGGVPASMESVISQSMKQIENAPEPSFLSTVWAGTFSSLLFGLLFGLIIAGVLSRAPRPFDEQPEA